jgi:hypothetical protein
MRIIPAKVKNKKLIVNGIEPDDITLLSMGSGDSSGYLLIGKDNVAAYIVNTQPDLSNIIGQLTYICDQLVAIGDHAYITAAQGQVLSTPLKAVSEQANAIKNKLEKMELI